MTEPNADRRRWLSWAALVVVLVVIWVLYPQLKDFGGEIYRFFA
jgi:hypothetical protein